ncbi:hypothetical protein ACOSQ4_032220 [Xanthoceras sorbifolium]
MDRRGFPHIRIVATEWSTPEGERVDESVNAPMHKTSPEPAQPAVPEGGNLNAAQMAKFGLLVKAATRVKRSMAAIPRPKQQKRGWTGGFQGGPSKTAKTGGQVSWPNSQRQGSGVPFSQASVKPPTGFRGIRDSGRSFPVCNKCGKSHLGQCLKVDQKTDLKYQGITAEAEDSREVEPSPEDPVAPVSPVGALVGVGHLEDSPVDYMLRPVYSQSPSRRLMLP